MYVLRWPKTRPLTDASGDGWRAVVSPGLLSLVRDDGGPGLSFTDPDELAALAAQMHAASADLDLAIKYAAARDSTRARLLRKLRGEPVGLRHRPFREVPEPPMHMEVPA